MTDRSFGVVDRHQVALVSGGWLAVMGGVGYFLLLLLHGDLPDQTTATALEHIAHRPEWGLLKWLLIGAVFCWVGAFTLFSHFLQGGLSWTLGRLAAAGITLGATLVLVEYSVLGYGLRNVAEAWAVAPLDERESLVIVGDALLAVTGGLFFSFITWMIGLPFLLLGLAITLDSTFPRWIGWVGVICGAGAFLSGTGRFLGIYFVPFPLLYGGFIVPLSLWLAAIGILMIRRAKRDNFDIEPAVSS